MLIGLCSVKGSPGVTTAALAMAARWPVGEASVLEADPSGGDLSARFCLPTSPGLVSLAAAARRQTAADVVADHVQRLTGGLPVVVGPVSAEQARAALSALTSRGRPVLQAAAGATDSTVLVDAGRLEPSSPALPLVRGADALVVMARPRADELSHLASLLTPMASWARTPGLVLIGEGYSNRDTERELGVPVMARLPHDRSGASMLSGHPRGRAPDRSALGHACARLARTVIDHIQAHRTGDAEAAVRASTNGQVL